MSEQLPHKKRSQHSKSRSGCRTCKIRHKRCDERRPACLKCTSTGRQCDGYEQILDKRTREWRDLETENRSNVAIKPQSSPIAPPWTTESTLTLKNACQFELDQNELWYLKFYHSRTAVRFSHYFQNSFWQGLLLRMCESHPAVCHALIAMGAWHVQFERIETNIQEDLGPSVALRHSTKAIAYLRESIAQEHVTPYSLSRAHKQAVLVTCLTLTLLCLFQGDLDSARRHLTFGHKLLKEWEDQQDKDVTSMALTQGFSQMHVHWSFCSSSESTTQFCAQLSRKHRIFLNTAANLSATSLPLCSSLYQMDLVQKFSGLVSRCILDYTTYGFNIGPASDIAHSAELVLTMLRLYRDNLHAFLVDLDCLVPENCDSLKVFSILIHIIEIKLAVAGSQHPDELVYDDHLEQFQNIAKLARTLADSATGLSDVAIAPFSYKCSVLPSLLWSAAKCRHWHVRRDILDIMYRLPRDDHETPATTMVLKRLIERESDGRKAEEIIPESARIYCANVSIQSEESRVELQYQRPPYDYSNPNTEVLSSETRQ